MWAAGERMAKRSQSVGGWVILGLVLLGISQFAKAPDGVARNPAQSPIPAYTVPVASPQAVEIRYVTATSLNVRSEPSTSATIVSSLTLGAGVIVLDRRNGWLLVSIPSNRQGWVSERYTNSTKPQPRYTPPAPVSQSTQSAAGLSCSPRRTCSRIPSCSAAQWYRQNCSWGGRLDRDNDGLACETLC